MAITITQQPTGLKFSNEDMVYALTSTNTGVGFYLEANVNLSQFPGPSQNIVVTRIYRNPQNVLFFNLKTYAKEWFAYITERPDGTHVTAEPSPNKIFTSLLQYGAVTVTFTEYSEDGTGAATTTGTTNGTRLVVLPGQTSTYQGYFANDAPYILTGSAGWLSVRFSENNTQEPIDVTLPSDGVHPFAFLNNANSPFNQDTTKILIRTEDVSGTYVLNGYAINTTNGAQSPTSTSAYHWYTWFNLNPLRQGTIGLWSQGLVRPQNASLATSGREIKFYNGEVHRGCRYAFIIFANSKGGYDSLYFEGYKKWNISTEGKPYRSPRDTYSGTTYGYQSTTHEEKRFGVMREERMNLQSVQFTECDMRCLADIMTTRLAWMRLDGEARWRPIHVDSSSLEVDRDQNSKVRQVSLDVRVAVKKSY